MVDIERPEIVIDPNNMRPKHNRTHVTKAMYLEVLNRIEKLELAIAELTAKRKPGRPAKE